MIETSGEPVVIKKYATRRLYNTATSTYITLGDLTSMVKEGADFVVREEKSGEDITRSILAHMILDLERKVSNSLLPITFLRQLIRFYGDSMQMLVPLFLEVSMDSLLREQEKFRKLTAQSIGIDAFGILDEIVQRNMEMFRAILAMFAPSFFSGSKPVESETAVPAGDQAQIIKRQLDEVRKQLARLIEKGR